MRVLIALVVIFFFFFFFYDVINFMEASHSMLPAGSLPKNCQKKKEISFCYCWEKKKRFRKNMMSIYGIISFASHKADLTFSFFPCLFFFFCAFVIHIEAKQSFLNQIEKRKKKFCIIDKCVPMCMCVYRK